MRAVPLFPVILKDDILYIMGIENKFRLIFGKGENNAPAFSGVTPVVKEPQAEKTPASEKIRVAIKHYLHNINERDRQEAKKRISSTIQGEGQNKRVLRLPEAQLQNILLRLINQHNTPLDKIEITIKKTLAEEIKGNSEEIQLQVAGILRGVESCKEAYVALEAKMRTDHPNNETWIATNDQFDARYKVDLIGAVENKEGIVETLYLVQVKSSRDQEEIIQITKTHQEYLEMLPQLIGPLNKKEASSVAGKEIKEILDKDRNEKNEEQLVLFGLVLDQYIEDNKENLDGIQAANFYEKLKKEGVEFSPFTVMGILKNTEILNKYRSKYFTGDLNSEKQLAKTADNIPFTEGESIAFYNKNNVNTIANTAQIYSVVMVKNNEVSRKELESPYKNPETKN